MSNRSGIDDLTTGLGVRRKCRAGVFDGPTAGLARFCQANPKPCPLLGVSETGSAQVPALGADLDVRTDLPRYRLWENAELVAAPSNLISVWRDDLVCFVIGCSFSFEDVLMEDDIPLRHISRAAMYRTSIPHAGGRPVSWADGGIDAPADTR